MTAKYNKIKLRTNLSIGDFRSVQSLKKIKLTKDEYKFYYCAINEVNNKRNGIFNRELNVLSQYNQEMFLRKRTIHCI